MRIVVAEDEQMFREVVCKVCSHELGHDVVGQTGDGQEAVDLVASARPNLLLLDLNLPRLDGFAVADQARRLSRTTQIMAVTASRTNYTLFRIERSGFDGYIDKGADSLTSLRQALHAAENGRRYFSPTFATIKDERLRDPVAFDKLLTEREREILSLIGMSLADDEIGEHLGIAARTVETFRHRLLKKLKLGGTPKLIRFAIDQGFTDNLPRRQLAPAAAVALARPLNVPGVRIRH